LVLLVRYIRGGGSTVKKSKNSFIPTNTALKSLLGRVNKFQYWVRNGAVKGNARRSAGGLKNNSAPYKGLLAPNDCWENVKEGRKVRMSSCRGNFWQEK